VGLVLATLLSAPAGVSGRDAPGAGIAWEDWTDHAFDRAARENRFVLLDLGAVWCHWCHVMEETTYKEASVVSLIRAS
jgi:uncharacterized protein YyaL (SSP411 family)